LSSCSVHRLGATLGSSAALMWSVRAGLLALLEQRAWALDPLAIELGCPRRRLELVLAVLDAMGLTCRDGDRVALSRPMQELLPMLPGTLTRHGQLWSHLPDFLGGGDAWLKPGMHDRDPGYATVVEGLGRQFASDARELARALGLCRGAILDVGAGSGVWSLSMAATSPEATVTGLDGPQTLAVFLEQARQLGLQDRVDTLAGDYHAVALPQGHYERIVVGNVLHLETPARAAELVSRLGGALRRGGTLVVIDVIADGEPEFALDRAVYTLHLSMRVEGSAVYPRADFERWATTAGLGELRWRAVGHGLWALEARAC
jgi:SAM-dependent methyltransferase